MSECIVTKPSTFVVNGKPVAWLASDGQGGWRMEFGHQPIDDARCIEGFGNWSRKCARFMRQEKRHGN